MAGNFLKMSTITNVCLKTVLYIIVLGVGVAVAYTTFTYETLDSDIKEIKEDSKINTEKISSVQITMSEIKGDIKLLLERTERTQNIQDRLESKP